MKVRHLTTPVLFDDKTFLFACLPVSKLSTEAHDHDFMEVFIVDGGQIIHVLNNREHILNDGTVVFIRPDDAHYYKRVKNQDCNIYNLAFKVETFQEIIDFLGLVHSESESLIETPVSPQIYLNPAEKQNLITKLMESAPMLISNPRCAKISFKTILLNLFFTFSQSGNGDDSKRKLPMPEWLDELCNTMKKKDNFRKGLPLMKKLAYRSHEHLIRACQTWLNQTPTEFINELRIEHTAFMLSSTDKDIQTIAIDCGFNNLSHFYHLFKQRFKVSPAKYRKIHGRSAIP